MSMSLKSSCIKFANIEYWSVYSLIMPQTMTSFPIILVPDPDHILSFLHDIFACIHSKWFQPMYLSKFSKYTLNFSSMYFYPPFGGYTEI